LIQRVKPEEYFMQTTDDTDNKTMIYLGLIILGIIACVSIVAIVKK